MKHIFFFLFILLITATTSLAQKNTNLADAIKITGGGTFFKPKLIPNLKKLGVMQFTVRFKQKTMISVKQTEKRRSIALISQERGHSATAIASAHLDISDGDLTEQDYREVADYGYRYFQQSIKTAGIDTIGWQTIANTAFYKEEAGDKIKQGELIEEKDGDNYISYNANNGNVLYDGDWGFAGFKMKRASRLTDDLGAETAYFVVTLDFADVMATVDVATEGFSTRRRTAFSTTSRSAESTILENLKVTGEDGGAALFWGDNMRSENLSVVADISSGVSFADTLIQDASKIKKKSFLHRMTIGTGGKVETNPVVVSTTREKYKTAAKKALEKYAEAFVARWKTYQN